MTCFLETRCVRNYASGDKNPNCAPEDVDHRTTIFFEGQLVALRPLECLGIALKVAWPRHRACCEARA